ncbi:MAG: hypothetical protein NVS3B10_12160 [Polyangiales bacterium]
MDEHGQPPAAPTHGGAQRSPSTAQTAQSSRARRLAPWALGVIATVGVSTAMSRAESGRSRLFTVHPTMLGEPLPSGVGAASKMRQQVLARLRAPLVLALPGESRTTSAEALGARIDEARLEALVRDLADPNRALMRGAPAKLELPLPFRLDPTVSLDAVVRLKEDLDRPAEDAKLDLNARRVLAEQPGRRIDVYATLGALDGVLRAGGARVEVPVEKVAPRLTREALAGVDLTDTLGDFETRYATDHKHVDRTFNLRLASSHLNGKVILPGETFDFNQVVGPRDEAHGYRVAKVIADGELVDGMGGGTCQVAGTLHGAALFAGLEIVQRTPHTRPSYYIKMGLDAAVAYPTIDLKLRNPFSFPVVLKETVAGGVVHAEILGPRRTRVVTFIRKIEEVVPFPEREVPDDRLPDGKRVLSQRGIPGFKVRRYRIVRDGPNAVREKSEDSYPPTTQIWHVGTGASVDSSKKLAEDEHPESVADVYLAITQGPGIGKPTSTDDVLRAGPTPSGTEEVRVAGETGTKGWSRKYSATTGGSSPRPIGESAIETAIADAADGACEDAPCKGVASKVPPGKRRKK